jgi:hypothetical protein
VFVSLAQLDTGCWTGKVLLCGRLLGRIDEGFKKVLPQQRGELQLKDMS